MTAFAQEEQRKTGGTDLRHVSDGLLRQLPDWEEVPWAPVRSQEQTRRGGSLRLGVRHPSLNARVWQEVSLEGPTPGVGDGYGDGAVQGSGSPSPRKDRGPLTSRGTGVDVHSDWHLGAPAAPALAAAAPGGFTPDPGHRNSRGRLPYAVTETVGGLDDERAEDILSSDGKVDTAALMAAVVRALAAQDGSAALPPTVYGAMLQRGSHHTQHWQPHEDWPMDSSHAAAADDRPLLHLGKPRIPGSNLMSLMMSQKPPSMQLQQQAQKTTPAQQAARSHSQLQQAMQLQLHPLPPEEVDCPVGLFHSDSIRGVSGKRTAEASVRGTASSPQLRLWPGGPAAASATPKNAHLRADAVKLGWQQQQQQQQHYPRSAVDRQLEGLRLGPCNMTAAPALPYTAFEEPSVRRGAQIPPPPPLALRAAAAAAPSSSPEAEPTGVRPLTAALLIPRAFVSRSIPDARPGDQIPAVLTVDDGSRGVECARRGAGGVSATEAAADAAAASGHYPGALVVQHDGSGVLADPLISEAIAAYQGWTTVGWRLEPLDKMSLGEVYWVEWKVRKVAPPPPLQQLQEEQWVEEHVRSVRGLRPADDDVAVRAPEAPGPEAEETLLEALAALARQQRALQQQLSRMQTARRAAQHYHQRQELEEEERLLWQQQQQRQMQQPMNWEEAEEEAAHSVEVGAEEKRMQAQEQAAVLKSLRQRQHESRGHTVLISQQPQEQQQRQHHQEEGQERRSSVATSFQQLNPTRARPGKTLALTASDFADDKVDVGTTGAGLYGAGFETYDAEDMPRVPGAAHSAGPRSKGRRRGPSLPRQEGTATEAPTFASRTTRIEERYVVSPQDPLLPPSPTQLANQVQPRQQQQQLLQLKAEVGEDRPLDRLLDASPAPSSTTASRPSPEQEEEEPSPALSPSLEECAKARMPQQPSHALPAAIMAIATTTAAKAEQSSPSHPPGEDGNGATAGEEIGANAAAAAAAAAASAACKDQDAGAALRSHAQEGGNADVVAPAAGAAGAGAPTTTTTTSSAAAAGGGSGGVDLAASDPVVARSAPRQMSRYLTSGEIRTLFTERDSRVLCNPPCGLLLLMQMFLDGQALGPPQEAQLCRYNSSSPRYLTSVPAQELTSPPIPWKRLADTTIHFRRCRSGLLQLWATRGRPYGGSSGSVRGGLGDADEGVLQLTAKDAAAMPKLASFKPAGLRRAAWLAASGGPSGGGCAAAASDGCDGDGDGQDGCGDEGHVDAAAELAQPPPQRWGSAVADATHGSGLHSPTIGTESIGAGRSTDTAAEPNCSRFAGGAVTSRGGSGNVAVAVVLAEAAAHATDPRGFRGPLPNTANADSQDQAVALDSLPGLNINNLPNSLNELNWVGPNYETLPGELRAVDRGGGGAAAAAERQRGSGGGNGSEERAAATEAPYCMDVLVACPPRSLSRYVTKAELELLVGPEVYDQLCSGNKLAGVRVMFEVNGRRLPEVFVADIERYNASSPFYLKASSGRGVDGLPWRSVPPNATVQWRRMADNTLVLAQVSNPAGIARRDSNGRDVVPSRAGSYQQHRDAVRHGGARRRGGGGGGERSYRSKWSLEEDTCTEDDTSDFKYGSGHSDTDTPAARNKRRRPRRRSPAVAAAAPPPPPPPSAASWGNPQVDGADKPTSCHMTLEALAGVAGQALLEERAAAAEAAVGKGAVGARRQKRTRTAFEQQFGGPDDVQRRQDTAHGNSATAGGIAGRTFAQPPPLAAAAAAGGSLGVLVCPSPPHHHQHGTGAMGSSSFISRIVATNLYIGRRQLQALYGPGFKSDTKSDMQLSLNGTLMSEMYHVQWKEGCHKGSFYPKGAPLGQLRGRFLQGIYWLDEPGNLLVAVAWDQPPADWSMRRGRMATTENFGAAAAAAAAAGSGPGPGKPRRWLWQREAERVGKASVDATAREAAPARPTFGGPASLDFGQLQCTTGDRSGDAERGSADTKVGGCTSLAMTAHPINVEDVGDQMRSCRPDVETDADVPAAAAAAAAGPGAVEQVRSGSEAAGGPGVAPGTAGASALCDGSLLRLLRAARCEPGSAADGALDDASAERRPEARSHLGPGALPAAEEDRSQEKLSKIGRDSGDEMVGVVSRADEDSLNLAQHQHQHQHQQKDLPAQHAGAARDYTLDRLGSGAEVAAQPQVAESAPAPTAAASTDGGGVVADDGAATAPPYNANRANSGVGAKRCREDPAAPASSSSVSPPAPEKDDEREDAETWAAKKSRGVVPEATVWGFEHQQPRESPGDRLPLSIKQTVPLPHQQQQPQQPQRQLNLRGGVDQGVCTASADAAGGCRGWKKPWLRRRIAAAAAATAATTSDSGGNGGCGDAGFCSQGTSCGGCSTDDCPGVHLGQVLTAQSHPGHCSGEIAAVAHGQSGTETTGRLPGMSVLQLACNGGVQGGGGGGSCGLDSEGACQQRDVEPRGKDEQYEVRAAGFEEVVGHLQPGASPAALVMAVCQSQRRELRGAGDGDNAAAAEAAVAIAGGDCGGDSDGAAAGEAAAAVNTSGELDAAVAAEATDELVIRTIPWISMHLAHKWYPDAVFSSEQPPYHVQVAIELDGQLRQERFPAQLKSYPFNNSVFLPGLPMKVVKGLIRTGWRKLHDQTLVLMVRSPSDQEAQKEALASGGQDAHRDTT
ncbi:hypothetical protein VOLCADRAFT_89503 [Volvox carteri f. nagariensis]|uniref:Uncharacterized protein n=1 Tax=Volvox carteri f. nagariensis TaxID=3068 RepID=D8TS05_VOLCA|nr:uncharacterized protein VOLCADRAFT_89503 [Volvox carteri f. nagariensis]EFJ49741.1 hypothetical protein VOLCADRAFT_89503 [Volvox carteri f. nagariensis]|eukprot:XP_002949248.1 hypothetical protein VOLCADRAFT_89503 [Volvox carteri f. nagariensis]